MPVNYLQLSVYLAIVSFHILTRNTVFLTNQQVKNEMGNSVAKQKQTNRQTTLSSSSSATPREQQPSVSTPTPPA